MILTISTVPGMVYTVAVQGGTASLIGTDDSGATTEARSFAAGSTTLWHCLSAMATITGSSSTIITITAANAAAGWPAGSGMSPSQTEQLATAYEHTSAAAPHATPAVATLLTCTADGSTPAHISIRNTLGGDYAVREIPSNDCTTGNMVYLIIPALDAAQRNTLEALPYSTRLIFSDLTAPHSS